MARSVNESNLDSIKGMGSYYAFTLGLGTASLPGVPVTCLPDRVRLAFFSFKDNVLLV